MTKEQREQYQEPEVLKDILMRTLKGMKFKLDCGHHVSFFHFLGNNITIYNDNKDIKIFCSQCGY